MIKNKYKIRNIIELEKDLFIERFKEKIEFSELLLINAYASFLFRTNKKSNKNLIGFIKDDKFEIKRRRKMVSILFAYSTAKGEIKSEGKNTILTTEIKSTSFIGHFIYLIIILLISFSLFVNSDLIIIPIILIFFALFKIYRVLYDTKELKRIFENEIDDIVSENSLQHKL